MSVTVKIVMLDRQNKQRGGEEKRWAEEERRETSLAGFCCVPRVHSYKFNEY